MTTDLVDPSASKRTASAARQRAWRARNSERLLQKRRERYARDRVKQAAEKAAQRRADPDKYRAGVWRAKGLLRAIEYVVRNV